MQQVLASYVSPLLHKSSWAHIVFEANFIQARSWRIS